MTAQSKNTLGTIQENNAEDVVDLEHFAKQGWKVPFGRHYRIRIDRQKLIVNVPCMTGREILRLVAKSPDNFMLSQKFHDGQVHKIEADEKVDFTRPGVERFMTLPLDPTEG